MPTKVWEIIKQPLKLPDFFTGQVLGAQKQRSGAVSTGPLFSIQHPWGDCIPKHPKNSQLEWYPKLFQVPNTFDRDNYC